jgi:hypothetical protein
MFLVATRSLRSIQASSYSVAIVALFTEMKHLQGQADHSKQPSDELKNAWSYVIYKYVYTAWLLGTQRKLCFFVSFQ